MVLMHGGMLQDKIAGSERAHANSEPGNLKETQLSDQPAQGSPKALPRFIHSYYIALYLYITWYCV